MRVEHPTPGITRIIVEKGDHHKTLSWWEPFQQHGVAIVHDFAVTITPIKGSDDMFKVESPFLSRKIQGGVLSAQRAFLEQCVMLFVQYHRLNSLPIVSNYARSRFKKYNFYFAYTHELEKEQVSVGRMELSLLRDLRAILPHLSVRAYGYGAEGEKHYHRYLQIMRQLNELDIKEMQNGEVA